MNDPDAPEAAIKSSAQHPPPAAVQPVPTVGSTIGAFFTMLAMSAIAMMIAGFAVVLVLLVTGTKADDLSNRFETEPELGILVGSGFQAGAVIIALAWRPRKATAARRRLGLVNPGLSILEWVSLLLASGIPMWCSVLAASVVPSLSKSEQVANMWGTFTVAGAIAWVLYIGLVPGVCEELFFRGFLQRRLLYRWRPPAAIGLASVLFALLHIDPPAMALALILGVWLGWVAWRTGSILPTIATHAFVNSSWNAGQILARQTGVSESHLWWGVGLFTALSAACFVLTLRRLGRGPAPALPPYQASQEARSS